MCDLSETLTRKNGRKHCEEGDMGVEHMKRKDNFKGDEPRLTEQ